MKYFFTYFTHKTFTKSSAIFPPLISPEQCGLYALNILVYKIFRNTQLRGSKILLPFVISTDVNTSNFCWIRPKLVKVGLVRSKEGQFQKCLLLEVKDVLLDYLKCIYQNYLMIRKTLGGLM